MLRLTNSLSVPKFYFSKVFPHYIGGEYVQSKATQFYPVANPVTQELIAKTPQATKEEFDHCVANAKETFKVWSNTPLISNFLKLF